MAPLWLLNYSTSKRGRSDKVVAEIKAKGGKAVAVQGDFSKKEDIGKVFAEVKKNFGRLDTLVNNAGVYNFTPLDQVTPEEYYRIFDLNVLGLLLASKESLKYFGPEGGSIINIGSVVVFANASGFERLHGDQRRG